MMSKKQYMRLPQEARQTITGLQKERDNLLIKVTEADRLVNELQNQIVGWKDENYRLKQEIEDLKYKAEHNIA